MKILILDTETTSIEKPFCYNVGYTILDTDTGYRECEKDFVVEQVWHNPMLFTTAYYADKRDLYVQRMRARKTKMDKWGYIMAEMRRDIKAFDITHAYAFNSPFDDKVFAFNCDWFKTINPLDTLTILDIRGFVHQYIAFTKEYQNYCDTYERYTESGNYSTTAETVFQYIRNDPDFIEEHTALADSIIEGDILMECISKGADITKSYKVYNSIPRTVLRPYTVIDADGNYHVYKYTNKRKLPNDSGIRLTIKPPKGE